MNDESILKRFESVAESLENCGVDVSVCDNCERTYPESWVIDNNCPFCGYKHTSGEVTAKIECTCGNISDFDFMSTDTGDWVIVCKECYGRMTV